MVADELARLVSFPTVSSRSNAALAAYVAERCEGLGFRVEMFQDPVEPGKQTVMAFLGPEDTDGLTLTGHLDVVPVEGQPWTSDPFTLEQRGSRLVGRGAADMKGFLAAVLVALEARPKLQRQLALVWTHDEEVGCLGSRRLVQAFARQGRRLPTACWVGEPTNLQILRMHPGHVACTLSFQGQAAHSSRPDLGDNALESLAELVLAVRDYNAYLQSRPQPIPEMERPFVTFNCGVAAGGTAVNIVPDRAVLTLGYRPLPGTHPEQPLQDLLERLPSRLRRKLDAKIDRITPALLTPSGTPLQSLLAHHALHETCGAATFATDGGNLADLGLKPLIFGPGSIEVAHQADEWIDRHQLEAAVPTVLDVIQRRCG